MRLRTIAVVGLATGVLASHHSIADDVKINSFVRAGGAISLGDQTYLERIDRNGDTGDSHFGLTASGSLGEKWDAAGQIFSTAKEGAEVVLDWAYATYRVTDALKLSMGKIKYPNLMVSEYVDIGVSYLWVRPPAELYSFEAEHGVNLSLEAFNGATVAYDSVAGNFEYSLQAYGGEVVVSDGKLNKMLGAKFRIGNDNFAMQAAYNQHTAQIVTGARQAEFDGKDATVLSFGVTADVANVLLNAEYAQGKAGDDEHLQNTAYYATLGYRIGAVTPHFTYSKLDVDEGRDVMTVGIKYQINPSATFKLDVANITPEAMPGEEAEAFQTVSTVFDFVF